MDLSDDWKSQWPVASVFPSPLLVSGPSANPLGPLFFNPSLKTLTLIFQSPSLFPPLPPLGDLTLSRFLIISDPSSLPPSLSSSITSQLGSHYPSPSSPFACNRLQLLRCSHNTVLAFFPTGENTDRVGYVSITVDENSKFVAHDFSTSDENFNHPIVAILVSPVIEDLDMTVPGFIGYVMARTTYAVYWFHVKLKETTSSAPTPVAVRYLGAKIFKNCAVVHVSWSPHIPDECVALMENGELFLFDLLSYSIHAKLKQIKWRNICGDFGTPNKSSVWLSCEFSWHPRVLIVARSEAVFLVDLRSDDPKVSWLAKIEMLGSTNSSKHQFTALSMAGSEGFNFALASNHRLVLCDIRKPMLPILQWSHSFNSPSFIHVLQLSDLRAHCKCNDNGDDDLYQPYSQSGFCIIMGSFWDCEFAFFCYGPILEKKGSVASMVSCFCKSFYAWELPSSFNLLGRGCFCGSCLLKQEFAKGDLPAWINWQQKKEIVPGFAILDPEISSLIPQQEPFGGFTIIRLTSSGKLESQRYSASWEYSNKCEEDEEDAHIMNSNSSFQFNDSLLYIYGDEDYKFAKRNKFINLDYLTSYLDGNLTESILSKQSIAPWVKDTFPQNSHQHICETIRAFGSVFQDVDLPTSIHEVTIRKLWSALPVDLLQLAFSSYQEIMEVFVDSKEPTLEFLPLPEHLHLPPFLLREPSRRSNKWSLKVQRDNDLVGPVIPLPILQILRKVRNHSAQELEEFEEFSPEMEVLDQCGEVMKAAKEIAVDSLDRECDIRLDVDTENGVGVDDKKSFLLYNGNGDEGRYSTFISKLSEKLNLPSEGAFGEDEIFSNLCPIELKFNVGIGKSEEIELSSFKLLAKQYSKYLRK